MMLDHRTKSSRSTSQAKAVSKPIGIELFSGAGGMSLGFQQAGFDIVAAVDNDRFNTDIHEKNFPHCKSITADVSKLSGEQLRKLAGIGDQDVTVLFGGPPCQGFSLIGKRDAADPRNEMIRHFIRLVKEIRPKYFVIENVRGLLAGHGKDVVENAIRSAKRAGYEVVTPVKYLSANDYGVPQKRQRVFILGYRQGLPPPSYPEPEYGPGLKECPTVWDAIRDLPNVDYYTHLLETDQYTGHLGEPSAYGKMMRGEVADPHNPHYRVRERQTILTGCLKTLHTPVARKRFAKTKPGKVERISRFHRLDKYGLSNTLRAGSGRDAGGYTAPRPIHPVHPRVITVREAARLHSFPDWFVFHPTKWHGFRQIGNAVPPRLACAVAKQVISAYHENKQR